ncbi:MAG: TVP38/TMEM64 family protein, partial [Ardenticatenaceae bacterium]
FILFFALQPLVFFPSSLMAVLGGCLYGPIEGFFITLIGANGAGLTSYMVGRFFGKGMLTNDEQNDGLMHRYANYMRKNSFEAILIMHLIFLPYDLVNYFAGFLRVDWKPFVLGTAFGSLPGILTFVLFGASIEGDIMSGTPEINLTTLAISGVTLMISFGLSQVLKQRQKQLNNRLAETI